MKASSTGSLSPPARRMVAGAGFFVAAAAVLSGVALSLTRGQAVRWKQVVRTGLELPSAATRLSMRRLGAWREVHGEPPPEVAELDGTAVEMVGIARPEPEAGGLWLLSDPWAVAKPRKVPRDRAVWIGLPAAVKVREAAAPADVIRARGVLRVGRTPVPRLGTAAYLLDLETLWVREAGLADRHHVHDDECDH